MMRWRRGDGMLLVGGGNLSDVDLLLAEEAVNLAELAAERAWKYAAGSLGSRPAGEYQWLGAEWRLLVSHWTSDFEPCDEVTDDTEPSSLLALGWRRDDVSARCQGVLLGGGVALLLDRTPSPFLVMNGRAGEEAGVLARGWFSSLFTVELRDDAPEEIRRRWAVEVGGLPWRHTWPGQGGR